jgi:hypothetical protein
MHEKKGQLFKQNLFSEKVIPCHKTVHLYSTAKTAQVFNEIKKTGDFCRKLGKNRIISSVQLCCNTLKYGQSSVSTLYFMVSLLGCCDNNRKKSLPACLGK